MLWPGGASVSAAVSSPACRGVKFIFLQDKGQELNTRSKPHDVNVKTSGGVLLNYSI